ncbi:MAG: class I SAM-dependent methyltransferase, partial [Verrucomicrobiota bacterium]
PERREALMTDSQTPPPSGSLEDPATVRRFARMSGRSMRFRTFHRLLHTLPTRGRCLDVGAGPGAVAVAVAEDHPDLEIVALEPSTPMIEAGRRRVADRGLEGRIRFVRGAAEDTDLVRSLGPFELVYSTYTLHHFDDPGTAVRGLLDAVAPGGALFLYDLRPVAWLTWIPRSRGFLGAVRSSLRPTELRALLNRIGARDAEVSTAPPFLLYAIVRKKPVDDRGS